MRTLALVTGIVCLMVFTTMLIVMLFAPFYIDISMPKILEIRGYGLILIAAPTIGLGLILAAYDGE